MGFTSAGRQRWIGTACKATTVVVRVDQTRKAEFKQFIDWIASNDSLARVGATNGVSRWTLARHLAWCWNVAPSLPKPDGRYVDIEVDGTYFTILGWCLLVAIDADDGRPLAFQWCDKESRAAYEALFSQFPHPPLVVATDGHAGCLSAIRHVWPATRVQRCLVHVHRDGRRDLTNNPKTDAGKDLLKLSKRLSKHVRDEDSAAGWLADLNAWYSRYGGFLKQRTRARDDPDNPKAAHHQWWYTHERCRRAYYRLIRLTNDGSLFTFLNPALTVKGTIAPTTNKLEGGINSQIKRAARNHNGLSEDHMRRAMEWRLFLRTPNPDPMGFLTPGIWDNPKPRDNTTPPAEAVRLYDTGIQEKTEGVNAYESGFGIHKGWAGRNK